ncbi:XRE family transcriptional regulator [uncultured Brachyspira sp.]|uniref:XRE family transcriptional regulator n=1 Tax=uncultured Brachyspira sp. TaxID=221953 RepID=UPI0025832549|nr:XRE family transcriptional regulator [uncultured Brachyspira sp.]
MVENETFFKRLKNFREKNNYSQKKLADILEIPQRTLSNYETGRTEPSLNILKKLDKLGCSFNYLIYGDDGKVEDIKDLQIKEYTSDITSKTEDNNEWKGLSSSYLLEDSYNENVNIPKKLELINIKNITSSSDIAVLIPEGLSQYKDNLMAVAINSDDMEPTISRSSIVICDVFGFRGSGLYVVKMNNIYLVKRISIKPDAYIFSHDNKIYDSFEVNIENEKLNICGQVRCVINVFY